MTPGTDPGIRTPLLGSILLDQPLHLQLHWRAWYHGSRCPYRIKDGRRVGVIGCRHFPPPAFKSFLQENKVGKEGLIFIFNEGGKIVAYPQRRAGRD
jgi:hypothetical protein